MAAEHAPSEPNIGRTLLTIEFDLTLDDLLAFNLYLRDRPAARRRRIQMAIPALIGGPLLGLVLGYFVGWVGDPSGGSLIDSVRILSVSDWRQGIGEAFLVSGLLAGAVGILHMFRRPILRFRLRRHMLQRPVSEGDSQRTPVRVDLAERGLSVTGVDGQTRFVEKAVRHIGDAPTILILLTGDSNGCVIPKRALQPGELDRARAIVAGWRELT